MNDFTPEQIFEMNRRFDEHVQRNLREERQRIEQRWDYQRARRATEGFLVPTFRPEYVKKD